MQIRNVLIESCPTNVVATGFLAVQPWHASPLSDRRGPAEEAIVANSPNKGTYRAAAAAKRKLIESEKLEVAHTIAKAKPMAAVGGRQAEALIGNWSRYQTGTFENLDRIRLRWSQPDLFELVPRQTEPFAFIRPNGERIEPTNFFTDGGSIPRFVGTLNGRLTPWGYGPAYLIHDWEFDRHHCGARKSFNAVRDTLMEALKTLMTTVVPRNRVAFDLIFAGVSSVVAKAAWNKKTPVCPIPPPRPE